MQLDDKLKQHIIGTTSMKNILLIVNFLPACNFHEIKVFCMSFFKQKEPEETFQ